MPYKDKEKQRSSQKAYRLRITQGITNEGITEAGITQDQRERFPNIPLPFGPAYYEALAEQKEGRKPIKKEALVDKTPAIMRAFSEKRGRLEKICCSLKDHNVLGEVRYGVGGPTFDVVGKMLEVTGFPNIRA